jgi:signal transduction histidine kinase
MTECRKGPPYGILDRFFDTVWPKIGEADAESARRRKLAVRAGHGAMVVMILASLVSNILISRAEFSLGTIAGLGLLSVLYLLWNLYGTRGVVALVLADQSPPPAIATGVPRCGALSYFLVQITLAVMVYWIADRGGIPNLAWMVLLPPVAYSVFLLSWRGIASVSLVALAVLVASFLRWHGLQFAAYAGLAFSFAILFTIVFAILAVHSEKSRNQVQHLAAELSEANAQLRAYALQAEELAASRERNRIAREIHDGLGHCLTVANVQLEAARTLKEIDAERAWEAVRKAQAFTRQGLEDVRDSVASLRTSPLEKQSLINALQALAQNNEGALPVLEFQCKGSLRPLTPAVELSLYRAAQEGITNAQKHSQAKRACVVLDFTQTDHVVISVADDGIGAGNEVGHGFGLLGLRERAQLLGGNLWTHSEPNAGFSLKFEVPA